ncbi:18612_t:CDS:2, partial [Gigaspora rosea]
ESEDILNGTILQRLYEIDHDLPEAHNNALYHISKEQQKQKKRHDRQIKATINFEIGEKVLVLDARKGQTLESNLPKIGNISIVQRIQLDQVRLEPIDVTPTLPPYDNEHKEIIKATLAYHYLLRTIRRRDRIESLVYAYYLGSILDVMSRDQLRFLRPIISRHYYNTAIRTYYVFEHYGVEQVYCSTFTSLHEIRRLSDSEFHSLL